MSKLQQSQSAVISLAAVLALAVLLIDLSLPLGVAGGVPYVAVVTVGWWLKRPRYVFVLATASSALTVVGYYYSPEGGVPWIVLTNRFLALFAIWVTAVLVVKVKKSELSLRASHDTLERRIHERTAALERENAERRRVDSALRKSEERLAGILDIATDAIVSMDGNARIQLFNQGAEAVFGYDAGEVIGRPLDVLLPARFREAHGQHVDGFLRSPERSRLMGERSEILGLRKDGTEFPARAAISKFELGQDTIFTVMLHDITDLKRVEGALRGSERALQERVTELEYAKQRLERQGIELVSLAEDLHIARDRADAANRTKSEFLAAMSHELRTPLNAIIGFSEIIGSELLGPMGNAKYRGYVEDIHASGQHLLDLINDILDLSKVESGSDVLHDQGIEVPEIAQSILRLVTQRALEGGVALELDIPDTLPLLRADNRKVKQILANLLTNAVKFTHAGGKVTLRIRCEANNGYVFQVADTGIGMAPEDIPKALSQFGQIDSDLGREQEGTGLGLPLTKVLVEQHGGSLELASEVGVGTTVTVRFPVERIMRLRQGMPALGVNDRQAS